MGGESLARMRLGEALLHLGDRAGARAQLEEALELAHISPLAQHLLFLVYGVLLQVPDEGAEGLALIERAEALFDPRWVCQFCPTGYHVAAATVCARAGQARARPRVPGASRARRRAAGRAAPGRRRWRRRAPSCCSPRATSAPPRTPCAVPPRAMPRRGTCSTSGVRARRWNGSLGAEVSA